MQNEVKQQRFGEPLSDFSLASLTGPSVTLRSRVVGKKGAVVVIWSSTCSHCLRYDEYFNDFEARHPDLSLTVVSARQGETLDCGQNGRVAEKADVLHSARSDIDRCPAMVHPTDAEGFPHGCQPRPPLPGSNR